MTSGDLKCNEQDTMKDTSNMESKEQWAETGTFENPFRLLARVQAAADELRATDPEAADALLRRGFFEAELALYRSIYSIPLKEEQEPSNLLVALVHGAWSTCRAWLICVWAWIQPRRHEAGEP